MTAWLQERRDAEAKAGAKMFMGIPDRWFEDLKFRCLNGHVSTMILKCSEGPMDQCLACRAPVRMTFPEDAEEEALRND